MLCSWVSFSGDCKTDRDSQMYHTLVQVRDQHFCKWSVFFSSPYAGWLSLRAYGSKTAEQCWGVLRNQESGVEVVWRAIYMYLCHQHSSIRVLDWILGFLTKAGSGNILEIYETKSLWKGWHLWENNKEMKSQSLRERERLWWGEPCWFRSVRAVVLKMGMSFLRLH